MNNIKILLVDDEYKIVEVIKAYLLKEGFEVITAVDGEQALKLFKSTSIQLVILDLMLPGMSGEKVCESLRLHSDVPIIMLTAKTTETNKIDGLAIGADDYVTKPFSIKELLGRVKALLRRSYRQSYTLSEHFNINNGELEINFEKMELFKNGVQVVLTGKEFQLLKALLINPGQVLTREQLIYKAFGEDYDGFDRNIDTFIKNLRQKLEDDARNPKYIISVYGVGYKFNML